MRCLVLFSHDSHWRDFRYAELDSLLVLNGVDPSTAYSKECISPSTVYLPIELPNAEVACSICSRSVLIHGIFELYSNASKFSEVVEDFKETWSEYLQEYIVNRCSWSVHVRAFCKTMSLEHQEKCRLNFSFLAMPGKVQVNDAELSLWLLLDFSKNPDALIEDVLDIPAYFGRQIAVGGLRSIIKTMDLKKRSYIGPTSLDHSLALILGNLARVQRRHMALDPFVGTASILVALSYFGANCTGTDIDARVLRGEMYAGKADRSQDTSKRDIFSNFTSYGLPVPELIRMDNHLVDRHVVCNREGVLEGMYDVIVTDPPYGIRAGGRKSGKKIPVEYKIEEEKRLDHVPSTQQYPVEEVMLDLMHTAARVLTL